MKRKDLQTLLSLIEGYRDGVLTPLWYHLPATPHIPIPILSPDLPPKLSLESHRLGSPILYPKKESRGNTGKESHGIVDFIFDHSRYIVTGLISGIFIGIILIWLFGD